MFDKTSTHHTRAGLPLVSEKAATNYGFDSVELMFFRIFVLAFKQGLITEIGTLVHKVSPPVTYILPSQTSTIAYKSDRSFLRIDQNIVRRMTLASPTFPPPSTGSSSP